MRHNTSGFWYFSGRPVYNAVHYHDTTDYKAVLVLFIYLFNQEKSWSTQAAAQLKQYNNTIKVKHKPWVQYLSNNTPTILSQSWVCLFDTVTKRCLYLYNWLNDRQETILPLSRTLSVFVVLSYKPQHPLLPLCLVWHVRHSHMQTKTLLITQVWSWHTSGKKISDVSENVTCQQPI